MPQPAQPQAPAWFYSALGWLGRTFRDGAMQPRGFALWLAGSDVDPYYALGATRLFFVRRERDELFRLTIAADAGSAAPLTGGSTYPASDAGIGQMYAALAASPVFGAVRYCYVPGVGTHPAEVSFSTTLQSGYDPSTGLRSIVNGTAVAQAVPLDQFLTARNRQIYDPHPQIVPLATSLVFDISENNTPGATTFALPICYTRDLLAAGSEVVNRLSGETVVFSGGPGFDASKATTLTVESIATATAQGTTFTTTTYDAGTSLSEVQLGDTVDIGVTALTCTAASPWRVFSQQRIIGFFRPSGWTDCLGVPIYDYGQGDASFGPATVAPKGSKAATLDDPVLVYDPDHAFLNGESLFAVTERLQPATYLYSPERIASILDVAVTTEAGDDAPGLSVTTAALGFETGAAPPEQIVDQLNVPVLVTVTTTPELLRQGGQEPIGIPVANPASEVPIGLVGGQLPPAQSPASEQVGMTAFVPHEALDGTGIGSIEIGTVFPQQPAGTSDAIEAAAGGVTLNLTADRDANGSSVGAFELPLESTGVGFVAGVSYILLLTGTVLTTRGSDGSSATVTLGEGATDGDLTYIGAFVFAAGTSTVELYPKRPFTVAAPAVGTAGVQHGSTYQVRLTYGADESQVDVIDDEGIVIARGVSVQNPAPGGDAAPAPGDLYFGSFVGGAATMTVWSVPVFLRMSSAQLPSGAASGPTTVEALASGQAEYDLRITDSSLFVFTNIDIDTSAAGSVSPSGVFLAAAVINSAPDDGTSAAFAPSRLLLGLVRPVAAGGSNRYVFVPEDDSLLIGGRRYLAAVVPLQDLQADPNSRPYAPVHWPRARYWQFANRHNPYVDVEYTGETQAERVARAQADTVRIGLRTAAAHEPMQLYIDTDAPMTTWPIYPFPFASATQAVDVGQLKAITQTVLGILDAAVGQAPPRPEPTGPLADELVTVPADLQLTNPYTLDTGTLPDTSPPSQPDGAMTPPSPSGTSLASRSTSCRPAWSVVSHRRCKACRACAACNTRRRPPRSRLQRVLRRRSPSCRTGRASSPPSAARCSPACAASSRSSDSRSSTPAPARATSSRSSRPT